MRSLHAPPLTSATTVDSLERRLSPYWNILEYCRHLGVQRHPGHGDFWVARVRKETGAKYAQKRLGRVDFSNANGVDYDRALVLARAWFARPEISEIASEAFPVGTNRKLRYVKKAAGFTIGDAMRDYVEWKRVAAAQSHFDSVLSLINFYIIPKLGDVLVTDLTTRRLTAFIVDILETPPKHGKRQRALRRRLADLDSESLRKRKKTVNTLLGILRLGLQMAWENGEVESERAWRSIRRLPQRDAPRNIFLTREQCHLLLAHCREDLRSIVRGALYTGCRIAELSDLCVADVEPGIRGIYVAPCKSYRGRYVHLPAEGMAFFQGECAGKSSEDHVFLMASGRHWTGNHKHLFRQAVLASGLPEGFVFHGLRHTYASQLVQAGTPLAVVARQLGHSNTDTVSRTYGHLSCECIERELELRFAPLEATSSDQVDAPADTMDAEGALRIARARSLSWPLANHSRSSGELLSLLRGR